MWNDILITTNQKYLGSKDVLEEKLNITWKQKPRFLAGYSLNRCAI